MFHKIKNRKKREEGQAMLEFVLVLPIFLIIIAIILDYGWLFYNYIGMENSARNAARVACVEYTDVCLSTGGGMYGDAIGKFELGSNGLWTNASASDSNDSITAEEAHILREIKNTMPSSMSNVKVQMKYTYDGDFIDGTRTGTFDASDRYKGDVVVMVTATHRAITPLVVIGDKDGSNSMRRRVGAKSVYRVEKSEDTMLADDGA